MAVKQYDPKKISIIFGVQALTGYADGTFVEVELPESYEKAVGADGEVARSKSADFTGQVKVRLMQTSKSNDYLSALWNTDRITGVGVVPFLMRDALGLTLFAAESAWIKKMPNAVYGKGATEAREWIIDCGQMDAVLAGS